MNCHEYGNSQEKGLGLQGCIVVRGTNAAEVRFCIHLWRAWVSCRCGRATVVAKNIDQRLNGVSSKMNCHRLLEFSSVCSLLSFSKKSAFCLNLPDIVLQCHSWNSCPNLPALDQSEFSFHNALFETVAGLLDVHWSSIFRHVGPHDTPVSNDSGSWIWLASLCMISPSSQGVLKQRRLQLFVVEGKNHLITSAFLEFWQFKCNLTWKQFHNYNEYITFGSKELALLWQYIIVVGSCPMLSSFLSWHLNRRNQNYILDLPAFNQGAFTLRKFTAALPCSHTHHQFMECFDCFVSSTIELSCLHWSIYWQMFLWCKSSPRVPCTNASRHKWNRNNSGVTFFAPTIITSQGSSSLSSSHRSGFPLFKKFAMLSGPVTCHGRCKRM